MKLTTRKTKVNFLKGLVTGTRSIKELISESISIVLECNDEPGSVYDIKTGRRFNAHQVNEWRRKTKEGSYLFIEL